MKTFWIETKQHTHTHTHTHTHIYTIQIEDSAFSVLFSPFISLLTVRVVWAPQMILQPVISIFHCSPPPSWTWQTPGLSNPRCCLPTSSSVCLVFSPLSLCLARWFWPNLMNGRHDHTISCSLRLFTMIRRSLCGPIACWHRLPRW